LPRAALNPAPPVVAVREEMPAVSRRDPPPARPALENPLRVWGDVPYARLFEGVRDVVGDYCEVGYANAYDGRIETYPAALPCWGRCWGPVGWDFLQRFLAAVLGIRQRVAVCISCADVGGYLVEVQVLGERRAAGAAWVPVGRDRRLEQVILRRLARIGAKRP
jgi:hypothetical protein